MEQNKKIRLTSMMKTILRDMRKGERIYKYTGKTPALIILEDSGTKIAERVYYSLFESHLIDVDDASSFETWLKLTELGKTINID